MPMTRRAAGSAVTAVMLVLALGSSTSVGAATRSAGLARPFGLAVPGATASPLMDISKLSGNEAETSVAIQQTNTNHVVVTSNLNSNALLHMWTTDGGATWNKGALATGSDGLPAACCDSSLTSDEFGNIFLVYLSASNFSSIIAMSTDGGATFTLLHTAVAPAGQAFQAPTRVGSRTANTDQPTITAGHGEVWMTVTLSSGLASATGAPVTGLGAVGTWTPLETAPNTSCSNCDYGDIAIGPNGEVMIAYQTPSGGQGPAKIYTALDPDGTGPSGFNTPRLVTSTNVGGFDYIPAQSGRSVDAEVGLAWDRSRLHRLYIMWTSETPNESNNMDILLAHSDDSGATWAGGQKLNKDATTNSQFLPKMALDQTTGFVVVTWYDARNDLGAGGIGDTNGVPNDDAMLYGVLSTNGGSSFSPNGRISAKASNAADAANGIDYGDYEGLAYHGGYIYPAWADNSNTVGTNPNGTLHQLDIYTIQIHI